MRELDFLPPHYKQAQRKRRAIWRRCMIVMLLGMGAASWRALGPFQIPTVRWLATPRNVFNQRPTTAPSAPQPAIGLQDDTTATTHSPSGQ